MFSDKSLRKTLFGIYDNINPGNRRSFTLLFPAVSDEDKRREITIPSADGLILYLIKRIEKLEEKAQSLDQKKIKG